jgi:CelD/BcsL family acetyltransferase involved in cellulose biosynthesis
VVCCVIRAGRGVVLTPHTDEVSPVLQPRTRSVRFGQGFGSLAPCVGCDGNCSAMEVTVVSPASLSDALRKRWREIQAESPSLESPFYSLPFTEIVGAARPDCRVAVLADAGGTVHGFLPFHSGRSRVAMPVGRKLADYQGAIVAPEVVWDPAAVVRAAGLRAFSFDKVHGEQAALRPHFDGVEPSWVIDISDGFDAYVEGQREAGRGGPKDARVKERRLRRRFDLRFSFHETDIEPLRALLAWKSEQYRRTGNFDIFTRRWVVEVVERCHAVSEPDLAGVLSCLWADGRLIGAHLGLRSGSVLHYWFPAYDMAFSAFSPGSVLILSMAAAAPEHGIRVIDLGKGAEAYKPRFANAQIEVGTGAVTTSPLVTAGLRMERAAWALPLRTRFDKPFRRMQRRLKFD